MFISKYNSEHYLDLTHYEAMKHMEAEERAKRFRPLVYVCSPYAGDVEYNAEMARKYSKFAVDRGYIPIAPHLLFPQFLDDNDPSQRDLGLFFGIVLLSKCSEVWVFGDKISTGMQAEINRAKRKNYPIRYFTDEMKEVFP